HARVFLLGPFAELDEVLLEAVHRIAQRPLLAFVRGAVARGVVAGGVAFLAVGEVLDQGRAHVGARALGRPLGGGVDREEIVAVDTQGRDAVADAARGKRRFGAAGDALERADGPL